MRPIRHDNKSHIFREIIGQSLDDRHKSCVDKHQPVVGMVGDVGHLLGAETGIERMADRANTSNSIVKLEVAISVPRQSGHTITRLNT